MKQEAQEQKEDIENIDWLRNAFKFFIDKEKEVDSIEKEIGLVKNEIVFKFYLNNLSFFYDSYFYHATRLSLADNEQLLHSFLEKSVFHRFLAEREKADSKETFESFFSVNQKIFQCIAQSEKRYVYERIIYGIYQKLVKVFQKDSGENYYKNIMNLLHNPTGKIAVHMDSLNSLLKNIPGLGKIIDENMKLIENYSHFFKFFNERIQKQNSPRKPMKSHAPASERPFFNSKKIVRSKALYGISGMRKSASHK